GQDWRRFQLVGASRARALTHLIRATGWLGVVRVGLRKFGGEATCVNQRKPDRGRGWAR
ncbi:unnamed protein product, partial [Amoebophrya sp. A25]